MRSFYDIIEISDCAAHQEIKGAYFNYVRRVHPDKATDDCDPEAVTQATLIWHTLKDPVRRKEYDHWLREQKLRELKGTVAETIELIEAEGLDEVFCRCGDEYIFTEEETLAYLSVLLVLCVLRLFEVEKMSISSGSTKIIVLGESEVGKTSLVNAIAGKPQLDPPSTIGVSVVMAWHEYRTGCAEQRTELIELWDIGGTGAHRQAASVLIEGAAGAIIVHDLSNKRSEENLAQWLTLIDGKTRIPGGSSRSHMLDMESCHIPVLTVGCKLDLAPHRAPQAYDRINVDCRKPIPAGSTASMALARFFDSAVDRTRAPPLERRRRMVSPF